MKVLFHINELENWEKIFENVNNLVKELEENRKKIDIIILSNGNSVKKLISYDLKKKFKENFNKINIYACKNSLYKFNIDEKMIIDGVNITNSGVYFIAIKEEEGYLYIKP